MSDFGVISPRSASGAMYARVPTILSVIMVVDVRLADALVSPKSEIFATILSSSRMFALRRQNKSQSRAVRETAGTYLAKLHFIAETCHKKFYFLGKKPIHSFTKM